MKKIRTLVLAAAIALPALAAGHAQPPGMTGNVWLDWCTSEEGTKPRTSCVSYILA
jgi:hypothetical protein